MFGPTDLRTNTGSERDDDDQPEQDRADDLRERTRRELWQMAQVVHHLARRLERLEAEFRPPPCP